MPVLSETKARLNHIQELVQSVQEMSTILSDSHQTMSDEDWAVASSTVVEQQQIIRDLLGSLAQPDRMRRIRTAIDKRCKRRKRIRAQSKRASKLTVNNAQPPSSIPSLVPTNITINQPPTLPVSNHQLSKANAFLSLFDRLRELHRIRSQQAGRPCHTPSTLTDLTTLWSEAANHYEREERKSGQLLDETKSAEQLWQPVLFGPVKRNAIQFDADPDMERLIEIR